MQVTRGLVIVALAARLAHADGDASVTASTSAPAADDLDMRLTLSSFLYRQSGNDPAPVVDQGSAPQNASPVRRFFGDLRTELSDAGLQLDARIRQTTSDQYQSGALGGGEYEIRTLDYKLGGASTNVVLGRQYVDSVGATKIDGLALDQRFGANTLATVFAGAFPALGSRSLDTDYIHFVNPDGTQGDTIIPVAGGLGLAQQGATYHGDVGVAAVYVPQDLPGMPSDQRSRVYATSSGYWRPSEVVDTYHFALVDLVAAGGASLVNGSLGIDARPLPDLQLTLAGNHVSTDLVQIIARNYLSDPDPSAIGVVQNNIALLHISSDSARGAASLSLAERRFELTASGGVHLRPSVAVQLADGSGAVTFPETKSADATFTVLDRRSLADLRIALSGSLVEPLGSSAPTRSRGTVGRLVVSRMFAEQRGQLEGDVTFEHFKDVGGQMCTTSLNALACFGTSTTTAAQTGLLGSWRVAREWLVLADAHLGYQDITSMTVKWPAVLSVTAFVRVQWRYR